MEIELSVIELRTLVNPDNVIKATEFLLSLDKSAIIPENRQDDIQKDILWLKDCLCHLLHCSSQQYDKPLAPVENIECDLKNILDAANNLIRKLTPETQKQLQRYLESH